MGDRFSISKRFYWRRWLALYVFLCILAVPAYALWQGGRGRVFPQLGTSFIYIFGNSVINADSSSGGFSVQFSNAPQGTDIGGGVIIGNLLALVGRVTPSLGAFRPFRDTRLDHASHVELRVRGTVGGERFTLKLRNRAGEGWYVVGNTELVTREYKTIRIPLGEFEVAERTAMGQAFDRANGLDAVILAVGSQLNIPRATTIHVSSLRIGRETRRDWPIGAGFLLLGAFASFEYFRRRAKRRASEDFIGALKRFQEAVEAHPRAFLPIKREDLLRDHILLYLNSIFEGIAVGEAFRVKGKTDVYIPLPYGRALVAECKIWRGQRAYGKGLDQLLSYLNRHDFCASMICFVGNDDFDEILEKLHAETLGHHRCLSEGKNSSKKLMSFKFRRAGNGGEKLTLAVIPVYIPGLK